MITVNLEQSLYRAATRACLAPSIHNTQPWKFVLGRDRIDVHADPSRQLAVIDPSGRQSMISCGAAIFGLRAALAAQSLDAVTTLLPDLGQPDLLATISVVGTLVDSSAAGRLDDAADARHSNRRRFTLAEIPAAVMDTLTAAAEIEGAWLQPVRTETDRVVVAVLSQLADTRQTSNQAYRVELRAWTTDDPSRLDGVPADAISPTSGAAHDDIPLRDFDTKGAGQLPGDIHSSLKQNLFILGTDTDTQRDWLLTGQALERVLLELTSAGLVASIMSQIAEEPSTRQQLRDGLRLTGHPHLILRVGTAAPTPASPRRLFADVIASEFPIPPAAGHD